MGVDAPGTPNRAGDAAPGIKAGRRGRRYRSFPAGRMAQPGSGDFTPDVGSAELSGSMPEPESQLATLKAQARYLEQALDGINRRLQELESKAEQQV